MFSTTYQSSGGFYCYAMQDSTRTGEIPELIQRLFEFLEDQRGAGLVLGEILNFRRQTVTQELMALGMMGEDWSAWYRLFSRERFEEEELAGCLVGKTLEHEAEDEPFCAAIDSTSIHRSSLKMLEKSWLRDSRFSAFRPGSTGHSASCMGPG